jgi:hypothetical protein
MTKKSKEEFCGVCAAIPLAFAGGGSTVISSKKKKENENRGYSMMYNISIIVTVLSVLYIIYYLKGY